MKQTKYKETEIGRIPQGWHVKELGVICSEIIDCSHAKKPKFLSEGEYVFLEVNNIDEDGFLNLQDIKYISKQDYLDWTKRLSPRVDDIVITKTGKVGASAIIPENLKACIGRNQVILRANPNLIQPHYLWHYLRSQIFKYEIKKLSLSGTILDSLHVKYVPKIKIPVPQLKEQKRAADFLDAISYKIKLNQHMSKTLEAIGQALFKRWFVDFEFPNDEGKPYKSSGGKMVNSRAEFGEIPEGWNFSTIGNESKTILGGTPDRTERKYWTNGVIAWINSSKVNEFRIIEPSEYITEEALNNSATKLLPKGTTVLAITGATLGQVSRVEIDTCANQSVVGVIGKESIPSEYIYFWVKYTIDDIARWQTGGAQQHINKNNIDNSLLLIPDNETMKEYLRIIKPIFKKISLNCFETYNLFKIRDSLLPRLMSGKIRVKI